MLTSRGSRWWLGIGAVALLLVALVVPRPALAAPGEVIVSLELDGEQEQPGWVCVVSRAKGARALPFGTSDEGDEDLRAAHEAMADGSGESHCADPIAGGRGVCAPEQLPQLEGHFVACAANERGTGRQPRVLWLELSSRSAGGAPAAVEEILLNGSVLTLATNLRGSEAEKVIKVIGGHYRADRDLRVRDARATTLELQPLCRWIAVRVPPMQLPKGADPYPTFELENGDHRTHMPTKCVRGSLAEDTLEVRVPYYDPDQASASRGMELHATLEQEIPLELPWRRSAPSVQDEQEEPALAPLERVVIEEAQPEQRTQSEARKSAVGVDNEHPTAEPFDLELTARWSSSWPGDVLSLAPTVVTFFWPRDACFFPQGCPQARLTNSGQACRSLSRSDGCYYHCPVSNMKAGAVGEGFRVPITFEDLEHGSPRPEWSATLSYLNQRFLRSVPAEQRRVWIDLGAWSRSYTSGHWGAVQSFPGPSYATVLDEGRAPPRPWLPGPPIVYGSPRPLVTARGDEIEALVFHDAAGGVHRIELGSGDYRDHYVNLPRARCGETARVGIEGARKFRDVDVPLRAGSLVLPQPMAQARVLYFGTGLSLGFTRPLSPDDVRKSALWYPALAVDLSLRFRPRRAARAWRFELPRMSYTLGLQPYFPLGPKPGQPADDVAGRAYSRFTFSVMARAPESRRGDEVKVTGAFGLGGAVGAPLRSTDIDAVGGVRVGLVPQAELLLRVSRRVELRLPEARLLCLESLHRHVTELQGQARDDVARARLCTLFIGAGVAGTW